MYFLPAGGGLIGYDKRNRCSYNHIYRERETHGRLSYFQAAFVPVPFCKCLSCRLNCYHVTLTWRQVKKHTYCSLLAIGTLHNPLVFPSSYIDKLLTHSADHGWLCAYWCISWVQRWHFRVSWWWCSRNWRGAIYLKAPKDFWSLILFTSSLQI